MRISDWSSDVCSSDLLVGERVEAATGELRAQRLVDPFAVAEHPGTEELDHQQVGVAVKHQAAEAVALGMHYAPGNADRVEDRHSVVSGKSVSVRVDLRGRRIIKKNITKIKNNK